jgi:MFS family permease
MFLNYIGKPSIYLPCCMAVWGMISILTGKWILINVLRPKNNIWIQASHTSAFETQPIRSYSYILCVNLSCSFLGALLTRFFLGFVEAAFFPGALFLLSKWYKRSELGQRTALLACGSLVSNAFGSLLASGILDGMDGKLGRAAWRYVVQIYSDSVI